MEDPSLPFLKLPNDVIIEILTWLPVKPLLKFKCVCKSWRTLISSKQFVRSHLQNSKSDRNITSRRLIMESRGNLKQCSVNSVLYEPLSEAFDLSPPVQGSCFEVVGSCNGLICLSIDKKDLILWNPSTRNWKKLPAVHKQPYFYVSFGYGFGFDKSNDDYKVVAFFLKTEDDGKHEDDEILQVYSLRNDEWKTINHFAKANNWKIIYPAIFVNGLLI